MSPARCSMLAGSAAEIALAMWRKEVRGVTSGLPFEWALRSLLLTGNGIRKLKKSLRCPNGPPIGTGWGQGTFATF